MSIYTKRFANPKNIKSRRVDDYLRYLDSTMRCRGMTIDKRTHLFARILRAFKKAFK